MWLDHKSVQDGSNGILRDVRSFKTNVKWKEVTSIKKNLDVKEVLHCMYSQILGICLRTNQLLYVYTGGQINLGA